MRADGTAAPRRRLARSASGDTVREVTDEVPRQLLEPTVSGGPRPAPGGEETLTGHEPTWPAIGEGPTDPGDTDSTPGRIHALRNGPSSLPPRPAPRPPAPPSDLDELPRPPAPESEVLEAMEATTGSLALGAGLHGKPPAVSPPLPSTVQTVSPPPPPRPPETRLSSDFSNDPTRAQAQTPTVVEREEPYPVRRGGVPVWTRLAAGAGGGLAAIALGVGFLLFVLLVLIATRP
jgi:hypothetical protein